MGNLLFHSESIDLYVATKVKSVSKLLAFVKAGGLIIV